METRSPSDTIINVRKEIFANGEYYHVFNRGVDKREIFSCHEDILRFMQSMKEFNAGRPIGSLFENSFQKKKNALGDSVSKSGDNNKKLVEFIAYCLNPNHYHFILKQVADRGIEKFMHRIGVGYSMFFNNKNKRSGALFQGKFKAVFVDSNEYLLHLSAYVNLNNRVHRLGDSVSKSMSKSSWEEYVNGQKGVCEKDIVLGQFKSPLEYKEFAKSSLENIQQRKGLEKLLME